MNINFKKLLPSIMRKTKWANWVEVYEEIIDEVKSEKIDRLLNQFNIEKMDKTDFINLANMFGFNLSTYEGYTETNEYFKRETLTIVPRILNKTCRPSYKHNFYVFNLTGEIYPLYSKADGSLYPAYDWWTFNENPYIINILDSGDDNLSHKLPHHLGVEIKFLDNNQKLDEFYPIFYSPKSSGLNDAFLDNTDLLTLDQDTYLNLLVRQILVNYEFRLVESVTEFLTNNSLKAFYNDLIQLKRATERLYFEPILKINYKTDNTLTQTEYKTFDKQASAYQKTLLITGTIADTNSIEIGNGAHAIIDSSITGVQNLIETLNPGDYIYDSENFTYPVLMKKLFNKATNGDFTEIALKNIGGGCILYSTFPKVGFFKSMYSNFRFDLVPIT